MRMLFGMGLVVTGMFASIAGAELIEVTVENLAPRYGTYQTPFWVGFHNGGFDVFDAGAAASMEVERFAEDGNFGPLQTLFAGTGMGAADGLIAPGGPFAPGGFASMTFDLSGDDSKARYFSYASMVIPSNDAFVGNDDPMTWQIFDDEGNFVGADFFIAGSAIYDAGTEVNDEIPEHTAFFGQTMPDTGVDENGVVHMHPGYLGSYGNPGDYQSILGDPMFAGADFTLPNYPVARVTIVPAPGAAALLAVAGLAGFRRRRTG